MFEDKLFLIKGDNFDKMKNNGRNLIDDLSSLDHLSIFISKY